MKDLSRVVLSRATIVDFIGDIFARRGAQAYLGEQVTMSEHMLQGALLAEQAGADDTLIAATLLHDIGHFTGEFPDQALERGTNNYHESAGAAVLDSLFPEIVTDCVRHHVAAKRYLCAVDPGYFEQLTPASVHSLSLQGGAMNRDEITEFRAQTHLASIVQVRLWDDQGKVKGLKTPGYDHYAPILQRVVDAH